MPTGFTSKVNEGATFKEFLFGFLSKTTVEFDKYHFDKMEEARRELSKFVNLSKREKQHEFLKYKKSEIERYQSYIVEREQMRVNYENMMVAVDKWNPISKNTDVQENLLSLKEYMRRQLQDSINCDCKPGAISDSLKYVKDLTYDEWEKAHLQGLKHEIAHNEQQWKKQQKQFEYNKEFLDSINRSVYDTV